MRTLLLTFVLPALAHATEPSTLDGFVHLADREDDALLDLDPDMVEAWLDRPVASPEVWNGERVTGTDLRGTVGLYVGAEFGGGWSGATFCSGTLIHPQWVLTAAHCLDGAESQAGGGYNLYIGFGNAEPYDLRVPWEGYVMHPDYNPRAGAGAGYDIGLVKLARSVDETVVPVNQTELDTSWVETSLTLVGFGVTDDGASDSGRKRSTSAPLIRYEGDLLYAYNGSVYYDSRTGMYNFSRWDSTSNVCQGDSGGSAYMTTRSGGRMLVAVNVIVTPGCARGAAGSTRTDLYIPWIEQYVDLDEAAAGGGGGNAFDPSFSLDASPEGPIEDPGRGDPILPSEGADYPTVVACDGVGGAVAGGWLALVGLVGLRRRR